MNPIDFVGRYVWIASIGLIIWEVLRPTKYTLPPADRKRYQNIRYFLGGTSMIPWLVMGYGICIGGVPGIGPYFRPQDHNIHVLVWYLAAFLACVAYACWVLLFDGDKKLVEFRFYDQMGGRKKPPPSSSNIKTHAALCLLYVPAWMAFMWWLDPR